MVRDPSLQDMRALCPLLAIDEQGKTDTEIQILFWKSLYKHTTVHVDQLHMAFARLITGVDNTPDDGCQYEDDLTLFLDPFVLNQPFDMIEQLRATYPVNQ